MKPKDKKADSVNTKKMYIDQIHGIRAKAGSRIMAWALIRNKCHELGKEVPQLNQIIEE